MHINPLFICSLVPDCRYVRFDSDGQLIDFPVYLATASLLPITMNADQCSVASTWWPIGVSHAALPAQLFEAQKNGVHTIVVSVGQYAVIAALPADARANSAFIIVPDAEQTLLAVARAWRAQCLLPVIAVTGSVGKTTTIAMLSSVFKVDRLPLLVSSHDNHSLNNVAIDVLHITQKHVAAVFEVGALVVGDVLLCADLLRPTIAIITAICPAHLQGIDALHKIAGEKQKIFSYFSPSQVGIVCGDYPVLATHAYEHPVVRFGLKNKNVITARKITIFKDVDGTLKTRLLLRMYDYEREIVLSGHHRGIVFAALAAASLAHFLYVPFDVVVKGITSYVPVEGRFYQRLLREGRGILIQDNYSISPESVKAAFHAVHLMDNARRKIAVIGNIPGLGDKTNFWHRHVGRELIKTRSISDLILVGDATKSIYSVAPATMRIGFADEWDEVPAALTDLLAPTNNVVLVTGASPYPMNRFVAQLT